MTDLSGDLRAALAEEGYDVRDVGENRGLVTVTLGSTDVSAAALRSLATDVAGDRLLGVDVSTERTTGDAVGTVLSVRHR